MALEKCGECGKDVSSKSTTCPGCGGPSPAALRAERDKEEDEKRQGEFKSLFIIGVFVLFCFWWFVDLDGGSVPKGNAKAPTEKERARQEESDLTKAQIIAGRLCKDRVKKELMAPSTASFPFAPRHGITTTDGKHHKVLSYVDSENYFGAQIRKTFLCEVSGSGDDFSNYKITEFHFLVE